MNKIAVATDSNSGITQKEAESLGVYVLPMPFMMDGETFYEDINLTQETFYKRLSENSEISTSQPAVGSVLEFWGSLLEEYEEIVYIPMSSGLSASYETAAFLAKDFHGRVHVVNNQRISVTLRRSVLDALELSRKGLSALLIKEALEETKFETRIYIMLDTLKYIKRGGRITPAGAAIGTILNIKPVLQIKGEKLDSFAKARGAKQARRIMIEAVRKDFEADFGGLGPENFWIQTAYTYDLETALDFRKEVAEAFCGCEIQEPQQLSLSVSCHIGPGALAIAFVKKMGIYV